ncbi:MAG: DUF1109 domain-containing protein [Rhodospirillales bacterium]|nr:DUF1109 domain-containing protein [Rhodospirillales bacterium]MCB9995765.1 DUF1109 domain-containing protein [Rhodospirillales bacterium]
MSGEKDIDTLIDDLSADLSPVKRIFKPFLWVSPWFVVAMAYLGGVINFLGLRMDLSTKIHEMPFIFEMGLTGMIAVSAGYSAGWLAIPDMREQRWMLAVPTTFFAVFMLFILSAVITSGVHIESLSWHHCFSDALLMAVVPISTLMLLLKRGATTHPYWMSFMSVLSVGALGWASLRLTCPADHLGHTLLFHFLPFILCAVVLGSLARRIYRW